MELDHSILVVHLTPYNEIPVLWGILGEIFPNSLPYLTEFLLLNLASSDAFYGTYVKAFKAHVTVISSV